MPRQVCHSFIWDQEPGHSAATFPRGLGLTMAHSASRRSHFGLARLTARSRWLNLAQDRLTYHHEFRAEARSRHGLVSLIERTDQSGSGNGGRMDGRAKGRFGLQLERAAWKAASQAITRRSETFRRPLPFLATPHRATTRVLTGLDLVPAIGGACHLTLRLCCLSNIEKSRALIPFAQDPVKRSFFVFHTMLSRGLKAGISTPTD